MRVVAGEYRSRPLRTMKGDNTRPTTDKIKESMFNLIGGFFDGGECLDFYAGSGALAIEAVSRGMNHAVLTEQHREALQVIRTNVEMTKEEHKFTILSGVNYRSLLSYCMQHECVFDLVFLDPPYKKQRIVHDIEWLLEHHFVTDSTYIVCETDSYTLLPDEVGIFVKSKHKVYGTTAVHVYTGKDVE